MRTSRRLLREVLEHLLGIDETNVDCFNLSNRARKTYLLIGCNEDLNKIRVLDSESIGLRFNIFSQRLNFHGNI